MNQPWPTAGMRQRLLDLKQTATALRELPADMDLAVGQSLARYLTVRSAGYIEAIRDDVADVYATVRSPVEVARRVRHNLRTGQGATPDQLVTFVRTFSPSWAIELTDYLEADDAALRSSLGALVAARKKIAHGDGENVTSARALVWARTAEEVGGWMLHRFDPH